MIVAVFDESALIETWSKQPIFKIEENLAKLKEIGVHLICKSLTPTTTTTLDDLIDT